MKEGMKDNLHQLEKQHQHNPGEKDINLTQHKYNTQ